MSQYLLATREGLKYHFLYLKLHFETKFRMVDSYHSSENLDKKSDSKIQFLFDEVDDELIKELKSLNFDYAYKDRKIKLK